MNELYHHGIKGQKHGIRLYQNKDGSLTPLGRIRYRKMRSERSGDQPATNAAGEKAASSAPAKPREYITNRRNLRRLDLTRMDDATLTKLKQRLQLEQDVTKLIDSLSPKKKSVVKNAVNKAVSSLANATLNGMSTRLNRAIAGTNGQDQKKNKG